MGHIPPTAGRGSEESYDERDIRHRGHQMEPRPAQFANSEPDLQLTEEIEPAELNDKINRKSHNPSETPRPPASYTTHS